MNFKYLYILLALVLGCVEGPQIAYDRSWFGNVFYRSISLIDSVEAGNRVQLEGIYGYRNLQRKWQPVIQNWQQPGQMGYAFLSDSLLTETAVYLSCTGTVVIDTLYLKPDIQLPIKKIKIDTVLSQISLYSFLEKNRVESKKYINLFDDRFKQKGTDLNLPAEFAWQLVFDEKKQQVVVYSRIERISQVIQIEFVYDHGSEELLSVFALEQFKGE